MQTIELYWTQTAAVHMHVLLSHSGPPLQRGHVNTKVSILKGYCD